MLHDGISYTGDVDYEDGPYEMNIKEGDMNTSICINIIDDNELENDEIFNLRISVFALNTLNIYPKDPYSANVTILDDECT